LRNGPVERSSLSYFSEEAWNHAVPPCHTGDITFHNSQNFAFMQTQMVKPMLLSNGAVKAQLDGKASFLVREYHIL